MREVASPTAVEFSAPQTSLAPQVMEAQGLVGSTQVPLTKSWLVLQPHPWTEHVWVAGQAAQPLLEEQGSCAQEHWGWEMIIDEPAAQVEALATQLPPFWELHQTQPGVPEQPLQVVSPVQEGATVTATQALVVVSAK
jgi:hypothetical protein